MTGDDSLRARSRRHRTAYGGGMVAATLILGAGLIAGLLLCCGLAGTGPTW